MTDEHAERRLAAVLAADVARYSRLMEADEEGTLARLTAVRKALVDPAIAQKAIARLRQLNPALRVSNLKDVLGPYQHAEDLALYKEGLRQAGLPE